MKKLFVLISIALFVVIAALPLSACKNSSFVGEYRVNTLSCMGLTANQKSFKKYLNSRSEADKNYNSLYTPLSLLFGANLTLSENNNAKLVIANFESSLTENANYSTTLESAQNKGYIKDGSLVIENLKWSVDKSQKNAYFIYAVDSDENKISLSEIWGDKLFSADHIHARIENGKLACSIKVCIYSTDESDKTTVVLTTNIIINMKNK